MVPLALASLLGSTSALLCRPSGVIVAGTPGVSAGQCIKFDLSGLTGTYQASDSYPEPYLIGPPCAAAADTSGCKACAGAGPAPAFQLEPSRGCGGSRCFPIGDEAGGGVGITVSPTGLTLSLPGRSRTLVYDIGCNASAPAATSRPVSVHQLKIPSPMTYVVTWPSSAGCGVPIAGSICTNATSPTVPPTPPPPRPPGEVAKPTAAQIDWMQDDLGAIGHFNMGTFHACGIGGQLVEGIGSPMIDLPPAQDFAPTEVNTDTWLAALKSFGAKRAVLVVSHGCGFNTFPSKTAFPEFGFEYNYTIARSPWMGGKGDIAAMFIASCKKYGIQPGFYHGAMNNAFLNVLSGRVRPGVSGPGGADITQDMYTKILLANLRQLWTDYGPLAEVWFDGGYPPGTADLIAALQQELQPNAVGFQGPGKNVIRWCGTESGHVAEPFWSSAQSSLAAGAGAFAGAVFSPGEADTCFQGGCGVDAPPSAQWDDLPGPYGGCWFYNEGSCPKSLSSLISTYHDSIGHNAYLLLDWTPTKSGAMRSDHLQRYQEFGSFLRTCYGSGSAGSVFNQTVTNTSKNTFALDVKPGVAIDRVVLMEDQTDGQKINAFSVSVDGVEVVSGRSIGHKFIGLFAASMTVKASVSVTISSTVGPTTLLEASVYNCTREPTSSGCSLQQDFSFKIVPSIIISTGAVANEPECCSKCWLEPTCASFVLAPDRTCTLISANQGGAPKKGYVSGTPQR